ncbi:MAG: hypothetical protein EOM31_02265 [Bacteroidia bacterium]|nr:hypothetical protein [Bacteroidia bacterium]
MKRFKLGTKMKLGIICLCLSYISRQWGLDHPSSLLSFTEGFTIGLGLVLIVSGYFTQRKVSNRS